MAKFAKALRAAQAASEELREVEVLQHDSTGTFVDFLSWGDLKPSGDDGRWTGRVEDWIERVKLLGFNV